MNIRILKALHGDAIWISTDTKEGRKHLVIDTGPKGARKILKNIQKELTEKDEVIDLLIITHVDDDHLGGMQKLLSLNMIQPELYREVWINKGEDYRIDDELYGVGNGRYMIEQLQDMDINVLTEVTSGMQKAIGDMNITVISPTISMFKDMSESWSKIESNDQYSGESDSHKNLIELISNKEVSPDTSMQNNASITILIEHEGKKYLFLGDVGTDAVIAGASEVFEDVPLAVDYIKLPHHGSSRNVTQLLVKAFPTENYILSTIGRSGKPHKQSIAWLLKGSKAANINILSNYNWWEPYNRLTEDDKERYIKTGKLRLFDLSDNWEDKGVIFTNE